MRLMLIFAKISFIFLVFFSAGCSIRTKENKGSAITLVSDGKPLFHILIDPYLLPIDQEPEIIGGNERGVILYDSLGEQRTAIRKLLFYVKQISGAELQIEPAKRESKGCFIGLSSSFPWLEQSFEDVGHEGFRIGREGESVYIIANNPLGIRHAINTILMDQGCRWFFPGKEWEELPANPTITLTPTTQVPSFDMGRVVWYGYGTYEKPARDKSDWDYHNRMGSIVFVNIGHTNYGIDFEKDFETHPEWFALVKGQRKASQVCYSNRDVVAKMTQYALEAAEGGASSISMSPADGLGFCECGLCFETARGGEIKEEKGTFFATRPDGVQVCTVSETLFHAVNQVAEVVTEKFPGVILGCYGYSAYSHPPSFKLHKNVFVQTTTHYRRTPLKLEEQLELWGKRCDQVGIRGYWSVYQWDWDNPSVKDFTPGKIQEDLKFYHDHNVKAFVTEASNNWGPRGLSYYVGSQLLWNVDVNVKDLLKDFYEKAFGPAAEAVQRYYSRWYGPSVLVFDTSASIENEMQDVQGSLDEFGIYDPKSTLTSISLLKAAFKDLDEAAQLVQNMPRYQSRIDQLRMYLVYLRMRHQVWDTSAMKNEEALITAIKNEVMFGARLTNTNMIHTKPLLGKAFNRLFKEYEPLLFNIPESQLNECGWRYPGELPPTPSELAQYWTEGKKYVGLNQ